MCGLFDLIVCIDSDSPVSVPHYQSFWDSCYDLRRCDHFRICLFSVAQRTEDLSSELDRDTTLDVH